MKSIPWIIRSPQIKGISGETAVDDAATDAEIIEAIQREFLSSLSVHFPYRSGDVHSDGRGYTFSSRERRPVDFFDKMEN